MRRITGFCLMAVLAAGLVGCGSSETVATAPNPGPGGRPSDERLGTIDLFGLSDSDVSPEDVITVNRFLWNASLDVLTELPLAFVDAYGGVIGTEWIIDPETPDERTRVVARVRGLELRARGLAVAVYRQTRTGSGDWVVSSASAETSAAIEDSILQQARRLRSGEPG